MNRILLYVSFSFKYYQRMQKHRKNPEVQSDLGYYNSQFKGASRAASDTRSRPRYPLQQGRDGHEWERYSQRSVGDGYASDVDGFSYAGWRTCKTNTKLLFLLFIYLKIAVALLYFNF